MGHEFEALSGKILEAAVAVALELQLPNAGRQTCGPLISYFRFSPFRDSYWIPQR